MHYRIDGPANGTTVVFANALGTDLRMWDGVLAHLPGIRAVRFDKRGHGLSDEGSDFSIGDLAQDAAALIEHATKGPVIVVGLSIGGMIAQALCASRPDLVRAAILSNTAPRLGTTDSWNERIAAVQEGGIASIADKIMERWFTPRFRVTPQLATWRNMVARSPALGYVAACRALAATDLTRTVTGLRLPVMVIGGSEDGSSPPELVGATARLIPGARLHMIPNTGHLPCIEAPGDYAALIAPFIKAHAR